jgi:hypothetical protein
MTGKKKCWAADQAYRLMWVCLPHTQKGLHMPQQENSKLKTTLSVWGKYKLCTKFLKGLKLNLTEIREQSSCIHIDAYAQLYFAPLFAILLLNAILSMSATAIGPFQRSTSKFGWFFSRIQQPSVTLATQSLLALRCRLLEALFHAPNISSKRDA